MSDIIVAPETRDLGVLSDQLTSWLAQQMPEASEIKVDNLDYPRGAGMSHETVLFDMHWREGGAARSQGCVVRIKPGDFTVFPNDLFDQQYALMKLLHEGNYVRVAKVMWLEQDTTILGKPFFVMEKMVGRVPVKATAENGAIRPGDLLVASAIPGHAMRGPANPAGSPSVPYARYMNPASGASGPRPSKTSIGDRRSSRVSMTPSEFRWNVGAE